MLTEQDRLVIEILRDKWDSCAHDLLQAKAIGEGEEVQDMSREEVIDVIADMVSGSQSMYSGERREAVEYFSKLPWDSETRKLICETAFPYKSYGY